MKLSYGKLTVLFASSAALLAVLSHSATAQPAKTAQELTDIAQKITVRILERRCDNPTTCRDINAGSGVIVARRNQDNTYYVLTAKHVIHSLETSYTVVTSDGVLHPIDRKNLYKVDGTTIAIVSFTVANSSANDDVNSSANKSENNSENNTYQLASLFEGCFRRSGDRTNHPNHLSSRKEMTTDEPVDSPAYLCHPVRNHSQQNLISPQILIAGYPADETEAQGLKLTLGSLIDRNPQSPFALTPLESGYEFLYTNETYHGMSGGPILDTSGRVIGIHGQAEGDVVEKITFGYSMGIPIETFLIFLRDTNNGYFSGFMSPSSLQRLEISRDRLPPIKLAETDIDSLLGGSVSDCEASDISSMKQFLEYANRFYRLKRYDEALQCLDMALDEEDTPFALTVKGVILAQVKEYEKSLKLFTTVIDDNPESYVAWRWAGVVQAQQQQYVEAETAFRKAIEIYNRLTNGKDYSQARNGLVDALRNQGRFQEALDAEILDENRDPTMWLNRSRSLYAMGEYRASLESLQRAGALGIGFQAFFETLYAIGMKLKEDGLIEQAEFTPPTQRGPLRFDYQISHQGSNYSCTIRIPYSYNSLLTLISDLPPISHLYRDCLTNVLNIVKDAE
ncbi:MAG: tetratricopeptide repeat-containing serine protease family protein [Elainella sp. Prado103]|jgi:tetratricopeptide (TPR) repeat protein|nr:tetratricopeptide repeat-containing serine protease family protein [Elainella sp. Prado103]